MVLVGGDHVLTRDEYGRENRFESETFDRLALQPGPASSRKMHESRLAKFYFNAAPPDPKYGGRFDDLGGCIMGAVGSCCPVPRSPGTIITNNPQLLDLAHVMATSPCRGAGASMGRLGITDLDGEPWASPPTIGCDEVLEAGLTGPLSIALTAWPEVAVGGGLPLVATITGRAARLEWQFGDGVTVSDGGFSLTHAWTNAGDYVVTASVFNADHPAGVSATLPVRILPIEPPVLAYPAVTGPTVSLTFTAQPGLSYELQSTTNLLPPVLWQPIQSWATTGGLITVTVPTGQKENQLFRLRIK